MAENAANLAALCGLYELTARVSCMQSLDAVGQAFVDAAVEGLGFGVAALSHVRPDGRFEIVAVAGPPEARSSLLGTVWSPEVLAGAVAPGGPEFVPQDRLPESGASAQAVATRGDPGRWPSHDALFAPLVDPSGELLGALSVDLPHGQEDSGPLQAELLAMLAAHAGVAIHDARLAQELRDEIVRLRASEQSLRRAFEGAGVGLAMVSLDPDDPGRFLRANAALSRITGHSVEKLMGMRFTDLIHPDDVAGSLKALARLMTGAQDQYRTEKRYLHADATPVWVNVTHTAVRDSDGVARSGFAQIEEISDRKAAELQLAQAVLSDPLTGLANRRALYQRLSAALEHSRRSGRAGAVLFLDLNGFKAVNDSCGHDTGDLVLTTIAHRLESEIRAGDVVARLGGDEFVVLAEELAGAELASLIRRLERAVAVPIRHEFGTLDVTVSIGVSTLAQDTPDIETLLREADLAMYRAKAAGLDARRS